MSQPPGRALLVDGEPASSFVLRRRLHVLGYASVQVRTRRELRHALGAFPFALAVVDHQIEGEPIEHALADNMTTWPPVVVASSAPEAVRAAERFGLARVGRPFYFEDLSRAIDRAGPPRDLAFSRAAG